MSACQKQALQHLVHNKNNAKLWYTSDFLDNPTKLGTKISA